MAWKFPEDTRQCPSCGYRVRVLVHQSRLQQFKLSCGWCAKLSEPMDAQRAFFKAWGAPAEEAGAILNLDGVPHWQRGRYVESIPITAILSETTALVTVRKESA